MKKLLAGLALLWSGLAAVAAGPVPTLEDIEAALRDNAPRERLLSLISCDDEANWSSSVCGQIASGAPAWIALAPRIRAQTDGANSGAICNALGLAMRKAPREVLRVYEPQGKLSASCLCVPFVSDELPVAEQAREYRLSHRAIASVGDRKLRTARAACLAEMAPVERRFAAQAKGLSATSAPSR